MLGLIIIGIVCNLILMYVVRSFFKEVFSKWNKPLAIIFMIPPIGIITGVVVLGVSVIVMACMAFQTIFGDYFK